MAIDEEIPVRQERRKAVQMAAREECFLQKPLALTAKIAPR
jgi:hypothetical protein